MKLLLALAVLLLSQAARAAPAALNIFAAASLTDAFHDIATLWQSKGHPAPVLSFAASSTLAQQIEHGAPADVFASADELWMDRLQQDGRIRAETRTDFAGNTLVLAERMATLKTIALKPGLDLGMVLGPSGRLAVGDPAHVPAGIYAKQALQKLGAWEAVAGRLAPADSVRSALMLVSTGEAPAGIVYATDLHAARGIGVAGTFPADSHDPIRYPAAATRTARGQDAADFVAFLRTEAAQDVLRHYGFTLP